MRPNSNQSQNLKHEPSCISVLPEFVVNQIRAGEVVERPAQLLKELLENAIDANATKITIHLENCGLDLLAVIDNGEGMSAEDLPWAFTRHATSKICNMDDLYRLGSYGFRGEALASIASVAKVSCVSRTKKGSGVGGKMLLEGGEVVLHTALEEDAVAVESGTAIFVTELFYNTPVRLKFLRSKASEKHALKRVLSAFLLAYPQITFEVKWDDGEKEIYSGGEANLRQRVVEFFAKGKRRVEENLQLIGPLQGEYDGHCIVGYMASANSSIDQGMILVNKRLVQDKNLHQRIVHAGVRTLGLEERSLAYVLYIELPPECLDVNIHPNKSVVKFLYPQTLYSLLQVVSNKAVGSYQKKQQPVVPSKASGEITAAAASSSKGDQSGSEQESNGHTSSMLYLRPISEDVLEIYKRRKLLWHYFLMEFKQFKRAADDDEAVVPLLVVMPFTTIAEEIDKRFPFFASKGFDFVRVNANTILLRTIPRYLAHLDYKFLIEKLLESGYGHKEESEQERDIEIPLTSEEIAKIASALTPIQKQELKRLGVMADVSFTHP
ncbi:MAG: DNA mismatch repair endonuclease MutL [Oligoflexia bacterium]|nr:DNA mismatch repair endonuclease MutL [Oligoflexia bacterium]